MCTKKISEGSEGTIKSARGLFKELEKQGYLGIDRLENLKDILKQLKKRSMLKKVEEFEIKRRGAQLNIMLIILICFEISSAKEILKAGSALVLEKFNLRLRASSFVT